MGRFQSSKCFQRASWARTASVISLVPTSTSGGRSDIGGVSEAEAIEAAVDHVLGHGLRTPDLAAVASETPPMSDLPPEVEVGTREMTDAVLAQLAR